LRRQGTRGLDAFTTAGHAGDCGRNQSAQFRCLLWHFRPRRAIESSVECLARSSHEERSAMLNRIVGLGTLFAIAFVVMLAIVFKDMFVWVLNNREKIWQGSLFDLSAN
jgi:hypothetical protein